MAQWAWRHAQSARPLLRTQQQQLQPTATAVQQPRPLLQRRPAVAAAAARIGGGGGRRERQQPSAEQRSSSHGRRAKRDSSDDDDDDGDGPGWWEVPREVRAAQQAAAAAAAAAAPQLPLEGWQQERLLLAAAGSKKKMQVQQLARDLGLDRSEVLAWVAGFRARSKQEQAALLAPYQAQLKQQAAQQASDAQAAHTAKQQAAQQAADAKAAHAAKQQAAAATAAAAAAEQRARAAADPWAGLGDGEDPEEAAAWAVPSRPPGPLPFSARNPNTGFLPFAQRRDQAQAGGGSSRGRRLPAEVLRTLEGVYGRSPWPNKDVVAGLFELHRLPRELVLEWFAARRQMDGLPDNPRYAKQAGLPAAALLKQQQQQRQDPWDFGGTDAAAAAAGQQQQQQRQKRQQQGPPVSQLTLRELGALRSGLPSPRKMKGAKLAEQLGIKQGAGPDADRKLEVAGITFVARNGAAAWRGAWRRRRAAAGLPAQRLDFAAAWFSLDA